MAALEEYDYVVVGAGSAGCVLANRLTEDPDIDVLLLEAGGSDWDPYIHVPIGIGKLWKTRAYDWGFDTEPQPALDGRTIPLPRGKVLGGSSSINVMVYLRGHRADYDRWAANGATGWSYADVLPYFRRAETWEGGEDAYRGGSGPLDTTYSDTVDPIVEPVIAAGGEAGFPVSDDINGVAGEGFALNQSTIANGRRSSTATAYLKPARKRGGLTLRSEAEVTRVIVENGRAVGVVCRRAGETMTVHARREVLLAAGAINSPQLLMLSGIGDADTLRRHDIASVAHLPEVGENLQDHMSIGIGFARRESGPLARSLRYDRISTAMTRAYLFGTGPASRVPGGPMALLRTQPAGTGLPDVPDLQFAFRQLARDAAPWWPGRARGWDDSVIFVAALLHPQSRGRLELASADPSVPMRIQPNYLSVDADYQPLMAGVRIAREVASQPSLAGFLGPEIFPGPNVGSDITLREYIRSVANTFHHVCSTCRMGSDDQAVVDPECRVRGVDGLRVVDASILPDLVGANINACTIMVAERAADLIRGRTPLGPADV